jgi:hypothetical protein
MRAVLVLGVLLLTGCATSFPLGEGGKYGSVLLSVSYEPPFDFAPSLGYAK